MKLGLVSAIYDDVDYEKLIDLVADAGLECVEVACWPVEKAERRYAGVSHINVEKVLTDEAYCCHILDYAKEEKNRNFLLWLIIPNTMVGEYCRKETVQYQI